MTLSDYQLMPYEREWFMRKEGNIRYYVVRLKDIPAVAGDGATRDEAAADLREAFDEFVQSWLDAGREVPAPSRRFTALDAHPSRPLKEWPSETIPSPREATAVASWTQNVELLSSMVFVEESTRGPALEEREIVAISA